MTQIDPIVHICLLLYIFLHTHTHTQRRRKRPENVTAEQLSLMFRMILHFEGIGQASDKEYEQIAEILKQNNVTATNLIARLAPKCSDMLVRCMWKGTQTRCDNLFQDVNTTEGVCCSFNNHAMARSNFPQ